MDDTLKSTRFVDADSPVVRAYAEAHAGSGDDVSKAVNLYYALRDAVSYDMRAFGLDEDRFVASNVLQSKSAFCVPKAVAWRHSPARSAFPRASASPTSATTWLRRSCWR